MRTIHCPAAERTQIVHILSDSLPQWVRFTAEAPGGVAEGAVDGAVEIERSALFGRRRTARAPLAAESRRGKAMVHTRFAVYVTPVHATRVAPHSRHLSSLRLWLALGLVLAAGIAAGLGGVLLRS